MGSEQEARGATVLTSLTNIAVQLRPFSRGSLVNFKTENFLPGKARGTSQGGCVSWRISDENVKEASRESLGGFGRSTAVTVPESKLGCVLVHVLCPKGHPVLQPWLSCLGLHY